jgi:phosphomannomutase
MLQLLSELRHKVAIGYVGGSNLVKQQEQLGGSVDVTTLFDFAFSENGLTAYRLGQELASTSFIEWIGEDKYKKLVKWFVANHPPSHLPKTKDPMLTCPRPGSCTTSPTSTSPSNAAPSSNSATA